MSKYTSNICEPKLRFQTDVKDRFQFLCSAWCQKDQPLPFVKEGQPIKMASRWGSFKDEEPKLLMWDCIKAKCEINKIYLGVYDIQSFFTNYFN